MFQHPPSEKILGVGPDILNCGRNMSVRVSVQLAGALCLSSFPISLLVSHTIFLTTHHTNLILFLPCIPSFENIFSPQGDVGGGHYYAYIRPNGTVGMNYESFAAHARDVSEGPDVNESVRENAGGGKEGGSGDGGESKSDVGGVEERRRAEVKNMLDSQARNGQWLKFNDETVMKVCVRLLLFFL